MNTDFTRIAILRAAFFQLVCASQWMYSQDVLHSAAEHMHKAEVLIELLEAADCGSHGGFDRSNPLQGKSRFKLFDRFLTVLVKYNTARVVNNKDWTVSKIKARFDRMTKIC